MFTTYLALFFGGWLAVALFALAAFWPFCRAAAIGDRQIAQESNSQRIQQMEQA